MSLRLDMWKCKKQERKQQERPKSVLKQVVAMGGEGVAAGCYASLWFGPALMGRHLARILNQCLADLTHQPQGTQGPRRQRKKKKKSKYPHKKRRENCSAGFILSCSGYQNFSQRTPQQLWPMKETAQRTRNLFTKKTPKKTLNWLWK